MKDNYYTKLITEEIQRRMGNTLEKSIAPDVTELEDRVKKFLSDIPPIQEHKCNVRDKTWVDCYPKRAERWLARLTYGLHKVGWLKLGYKKPNVITALLPYKEIPFQFEDWVERAFEYWAYEKEESDVEAATDLLDTLKYSFPVNFISEWVLDTPHYKVVCNIQIKPTQPVEYIKMNLVIGEPTNENLNA